jgi:energy-coupling factor transporter ATP-binding protein EcfA2
MGLTRQETEAKLPEIEEFCELEEWFYKPVRTYSTGMLARLGFGVALSVDADILLFDEILAVGDLSFQYKCFRHMEMLRNNGTTILLVSHNIRQIERLCEKAVILDSGQLTLQDTSVRVAAEYYEASHRQSYSQMGVNNRDRFGRIQSSGQLFVEGVEINNSKGDTVDSIPSGATVRLKLNISTTRQVEQPIIGINFVSADMIIVASLTNDGIRSRPDLSGDVTVCCTIADLYLNPGTYSIRVKVVDPDGATLFTGEHLVALTVTRPEDEQDAISPYGGFVRLDAKWE